MRMKNYTNRLKNWSQFFNKGNNTKEINHFLNENGFEIESIYVTENVKGLIGAMKLNNVVPTYLYEEVTLELDNPGGTIIFSTDLNSTLSKAETFKDKVRFFFESKWKTFLNRFNVSNRLRKVLISKYELPGYTVGKNFRGAYTGDNGIRFNEKSFTIDIAGVDSDALTLIASEICREFKQETVMVRDFNKERSAVVYFVNDKTAIDKDNKHI